LLLCGPLMKSAARSSRKAPLALSRVLGTAFAVVAVVGACAEAPDDAVLGPAPEDAGQEAAVVLAEAPKDAGQEAAPKDSGAKDAAKPPKDSGTTAVGGDCDPDSALYAAAAAIEALKPSPRLCGPLGGGATCKVTECCFATVCVDL